MTERQFTINTEPHRAVIGDDTLEFQAEVMGAAFAQAYAGLREAQATLTAAGDSIGAEELVAVNKAMRDFLLTFMLPDSKRKFRALQLPDRILTQLLEFVAELYGSGSGNPVAPGGPSSAS